MRGLGTVGYCLLGATVGSRDAGLEEPGVSGQSDGCDLRPGAAGALLSPVCQENGEGPVIDRGGISGLNIWKFVWRD